jgi:AraC-like DNA-binding protein
MGLPLVDWTGWSASRIDAFGPRWRVLAQSDFALRGTAAAMTAPPRRSALTAKFAVGGTELYRVGGAQLAADDDTWVAIEPGALYSSRIAAGHSVTTVAVFFGVDAVAAARSARHTPESVLLDDHGNVRGQPDEPLPVGRRRMAYGRHLIAAVQALAMDADADAVGELHALALGAILHASERAAHERERLPCVRSATRAELHRRLARAHDRLMTEFAAPLDLAALARTAAMAPHHFLRRFTDVFGMTPHRALTARRIERAKRLLSTTDTSIAEIAALVGFASAAGFSTRFRRDTGATPRAFRRTNSQFR